jgi:hypothetical protein
MHVYTYMCIGDTGDEEGNKSANQEKETAANLDAKTKFAKNLLRLSGMELGHVLHVIDIRSHQALEQPDESAKSHVDKFSGESEVEINVDAIDLRTFTELDRYVKEKMKARSNDVVESIAEEQAPAKKKQKKS